MKDIIISKIVPHGDKVDVYACKNVPAGQVCMVIRNISPDRIDEAVKEAFNEGRSD